MKTLKELINEINSTKGNPIKTDIETVCTYQDIIGNTGFDTLIELANDGMTKETFYRLYDIAYGTIATLKFYALHSDKVINLTYELERTKEQLKAANERADKHFNSAESFREKWAELDTEHKKTIAAATDQENEIINLKAKLYDLMNK